MTQEVKPIYCECGAMPGMYKSKDGRLCQIRCHEAECEIMSFWFEDPERAIHDWNKIMLKRINERCRDRHRDECAPIHVQACQLANKLGLSVAIFGENFTINASPDHETTD